MSRSRPLRCPWCWCSYVRFHVRNFVAGASDYLAVVTYERQITLSDPLATSTYRTGVEDVSVHSASHMLRATPKARRMRAQRYRSVSPSSLTYWLIKCKTRWYSNNNNNRCFLRPSHLNLNRRSQRSGSVRIVSPLAMQSGLLAMLVEECVLG